MTAKTGVLLGSIESNPDRLNIFRKVRVRNSQCLPTRIEVGMGNASADHAPAGDGRAKHDSIRRPGALRLWRSPEGDVTASRRHSCVKTSTQSQQGKHDLLVCTKM
jgi:hypothetical protein